MQTKLEIILPAHNEYGNVIPIYEEIKQALEKTVYDYTILFVDDGSKDNTFSSRGNIFYVMLKTCVPK